MDTLIRNIDDSTYRAARARAALEGRSVGEVVTTALREYLARTTGAEDACHLLDEPVYDQPPAAADENHTGTRVDEIVFLYCI
jgi:plasmid stability protein